MTLAAIASSTSILGSGNSGLDLALAPPELFLLVLDDVLASSSALSQAHRDSLTDQQPCLGSMQDKLQSSPESDTVISRSERREAIRIILESIKLVLFLAGVVAFTFAALEWRTSNLLTKENMRVANESVWRSHAALFAERPYLRAYFYEGSNIQADDENTNEVLAVADVRLDAMNAVLTSAYYREMPEDMAKWVNTFADAFRNSPVLCARLRDTAPKYGLIVPVADKGCL